MLENPSANDNSKHDDQLSYNDWLAHYQAWQKTSASKAYYCCNNKLNKDNFYYWSNKIHKAKMKTVQPDFVPLISNKHIIDNKTQDEVRLPNQITISLSLTERSLLNLIKELGNFEHKKGVVELTIDEMSWLLAGLEWPKMRNWHDLNYDK